MQMSRPEATSIDENVMISIPETRHGDTANRLMSTREAFDLVTELLQAIDQARAFGEYKRGEVSNEPEYRKHYKKNRRKRESGE